MSGAVFVNSIHRNNDFTSLNPQFNSSSIYFRNSGSEMVEDVKMVEYEGEGGTENEEEDRVIEWKDGLPSDDDLTPLSQVLIPLELASAFNIKPEPYRTLVDVNRASENTLSRFREGQPARFLRDGFKPFIERNESLDLIVEEIDDDRFDSKKNQIIESMEEADSVLRGENSNTVDDQSSRTLRRPRLVWTPLLHKRFVDVVSHLGNKNAVPKTIMQLMNVEGLTRENVASHLQKYRLYLKRMQGLSNEGPSPSDQLFASTPIPQSLHESGSSGQTKSHVPVPTIQMPYSPATVPMLGMAPPNGHGLVGVSMNGYNGVEAQHPLAFDLFQPRSWSGNFNGSSVPYPHSTSGDKCA